MPEIITIEPSVLEQMDVDVGILHEANRSFFHPLGMELLVENGKIVLKRGQPEDMVHQIMDREKIMKFRQWSRELHLRRTNQLRFIIQVNSIIPQVQIEHMDRTGSLPTNS